MELGKFVILGKAIVKMAGIFIACAVPAAALALIGFAVADKFSRKGR